MKEPYTDPQAHSALARLIGFFVDNKLIVVLLLLLSVALGLVTAPFDWHLPWLPRHPVPVDAIPDIGENQQIVFTEWPGRSPQDVEDQITYPLTVALLGLPEVKTIRSTSFFGFSSIYVIFAESAEFYASRTRILEKLSSLRPGTLPAEVSPALGPDATALGQVFWYTLEGRDSAGRPAGGWDLEELRRSQDWQVRYALQGAEGVAEVASIGGFVREYQVDVDPDALRAYGIALEEVFQAVRASNADVGARTLEINRVEYVIRGVGFVKSVEDLEQSVVAMRDHVPVTLQQIATVGMGPALRRGVLDKEGVEAVGGVVVARHGANPLAVIQNVKAKLAEIAPGLPRKTLADGTTSQITVVPFYDRTVLIGETLDTLRHALSLEILLTVIVVIVMMMQLRSSLLIAGLLPVAVLMCFVAMRVFGVDANIVALSGIAIAIGTMVDMGIVLSENILRRLREAAADQSRRDVVVAAATEVGPAVLTAVATTVVSFLPIFTMVAAEGKLFKPLAYTKTFALVAAIMVALAVIPPVAHALYARRTRVRLRPRLAFAGNLLVALIVAVFLTRVWLPLGPEAGLLRNLLFVVLTSGGLLAMAELFRRAYPRLLGWCLAHKLVFLTAPVLLVVVGLTIWLGFARVFAFLPGLDETAGHDGLARLWSGPRHQFPGLGKEFMPPLDEGSFLYMPTTMPHASIGEAADVLHKLDRAIAGIPEVAAVVGKLGRADSALDPAPISMIESVINYWPEYKLDDRGRRQRFKYDRAQAQFARDQEGELIPDPRGRPYRQWRPEIRSADDIWQAIVAVAQLPGTTSAPRLQPISARLVMLQSGMRAPMGVKIKGPDLQTIEEVGLQIERLLKEVPMVEPAAVIADRIVGKPYLEIRIDRERIARHGLTVRQVQDVIEVAVGGRPLTMTVQGRERYPVRVRLARERRDSIEELRRIPVAAPGGAQLPLEELADIVYVRGPQSIKSEDTFLVGYVLFDKKPAYAEVDVVEQCRAHLARKIEAGELVIPAGVSYTFAGSYENQLRSERTLRAVLPLSLVLIFLILYLQFRSTVTSAMVFAGIFVGWSGGFLMIWLYGQPWFLDFAFLGTNLRQLFQIHPLNLSVAVWVGFVALFGIASDDGVVMATYLDQSFARRKPRSVADIRAATIAAASRRIRPALMTSVTTILALLPILTSTGRGSDIMVPMAIPSFGGMAVAVLTVFVVPTLYCARRERQARRGPDDQAG